MLERTFLLFMSAVGVATKTRETDGEFPSIKPDREESNWGSLYRREIAVIMFSQVECCPPPCRWHGRVTLLDSAC